MGSDDSAVTRAIVAELDNYDIWVAHNGAKFDVPFLRTRLLKYNLQTLPNKKLIDLHNLAQALSAYRTLMAVGLAPFCPQLSYFAEPFIKQTHNQWLEADLLWVATADALLRLPGESLGANLEEACAREHGIPVFDTIEDVYNYFGVDDNGK